MKSDFEEEYLKESTLLTFSGCQNQSCAPVSLGIVDDNKVEDNESFNITLTSFNITLTVDFCDVIILNASRAVVMILDNGRYHFV